MMGATTLTSPWFHKAFAHVKRGEAVEGFAAFPTHCSPPRVAVSFGALLLVGTSKRSTFIGSRARSSAMSCGVTVPDNLWTCMWEWPRLEEADDLGRGLQAAWRWALHVSVARLPIGMLADVRGRADGLAEAIVFQTQIPL